MAYKHDPEILAKARRFVGEHGATYKSTGGVDGHIVDVSYVGGPGYLPTLLLRTIGRKSGKPSLVPLLYGIFRGEWVVVGSKGGAPEHPAWYLNLLEQDEVAFQVATQSFRAKWRVPEGEERQEFWDYMVGVFRPYKNYQTLTKRLIPLVLLKPIEPVRQLTDEAPADGSSG